MPRKGETDVVWDELEQLFGRVTNANSRGRRNRAVKLVKESLSDMAVTDPERFPRTDQQVVDEIRRRYSRMTHLWPGVPPTDTMLASHWDEANPRVAMVNKTVAVEQGADEPVAAPAVAQRYIDEMKRRGWVRGKETSEGS
jgi:hypothetical protein